MRAGAAPVLWDMTAFGESFWAGLFTYLPAAWLPAAWGFGLITRFFLFPACLLWIGTAHADEAGGSSSEARSTVGHIAEVITTGIEAVGMAIIVLGATIATGLFLREGFSAGGWAGAYERYRANLGRGILLGLELLVAADIVGTVAAPLDFRTIGTLGIIVLIRTFLSFSLEVEIKGHWPWQESRFKQSSNENSGL